MRGKIMLGEKSEIWAIGDVANYFGVAVRTVRRVVATTRKLG